MKLTVVTPEGWKAGHLLSRHLKGYNLEMTSACHDGMLADRLINPKFFGPAGAFGLPAGWRGGSVSCCRSVPGLGFSGSEALLITGPCTLKQGGFPVRAGETLEIEAVAKSRHAPVKLAFIIKHEAMRSGPLACADITVDTPCWRSLTAEIAIPADCDRAAIYVSVSGDGELHLDQVHLRPRGDFLSSRVVEAFRSLEIGALRFPGGCISTVYDWKKGLGPVARRPVCADPQFGGRIAYDFGLREFLDLCADLGCTPHLTIPLGCGTASDAADLARYCREYYRDTGTDAPHLLFQVGNEQYARHSMAHMSSRNYLDLLKEIAPALRSAYPDSTIIGLYSFIDQDPWRAHLLEEAGGLIDMVAYQYYKGQMKEDLEAQVRNAAESVAKNRRDLVAIAAAIREHGLDWKIGFTEWNYWLYSNGLSQNGELYSVREPMDAAHGLFIAGMLQMQAELGETVTLSNFYNLLNGMSVFEHRQGRFEESSAAAVMRLYSPAFPGAFIRTDCAAPAIGEEAPAVHTLGVQTATEDYLFVLNYSTESVDLALPAGLRPTGGRTLHFAEEAHGIDIPPREATSGNALPPRSITRFTIAAAAH